MMNYKDIQKSQFYLDTYAKVEQLKKDFPVNHGFLHVNHVLANAKKLAKTFNLNNYQKRLLYVASVLHDIGYINGREDHALSGGNLAKQVLEKNGFSQKEVEVICDAITRHGGKDISDYQSPISLCLVLADKLDFVASRYNPNIPDHPVNPIYLAIKELNFSLGENEILLEFVIGNGFNIAEFESGHFGRKLISVFSMLSSSLRIPYKFIYRKENHV